MPGTQSIIPQSHLPQKQDIPDCDTQGGCLYIHPSHLTFQSVKSPKQYFELGKDYSPNGDYGGNCFPYIAGWGMEKHKKGEVWHGYAFPIGPGKCVLLFSNLTGSKIATLQITVR